MGSKTGWIIAGVLVVVVIVIGYIVVFNPPTSLPRETQSPGFLELKTITVPLADVIGYEPSQPGNAADDYQKASEAFIASEADINSASEDGHLETLAKAPDLWTDPGLKAIKEINDLVAAGAKKAKMTYTFLYTDKVLRFAFNFPAATRLFKVAVGMNLLHSLYLERKEFAEADKVAKNMVVLGSHMYNEHCIAHMGMEGLEVQEAALGLLERLYQNPEWPAAPKDRLPAIRRMQGEVQAATGVYRKKKRILWDDIPANEMSGEPKMSAGDVFNVAQFDKDRAWQVQAIITLGAVKFRMTGRGDLKKTQELINGFLRSDEPLLAAAAKAANELTREKFRRSNDDF